MNGVHFMYPTLEMRKKNLDDYSMISSLRGVVGEWALPVSESSTNTRIFRCGDAEFALDLEMDTSFGVELCDADGECSDFLRAKEGEEELLRMFNRQLEL